MTSCLGGNRCQNEEFFIVEKKNSNKIHKTVQEKENAKKAQKKTKSANFAKIESLPPIQRKLTTNMRKMAKKKLRRQVTSVSIPGGAIILFENPFTFLPTRSPMTK